MQSGEQGDSGGAVDAQRRAQLVLRWRRAMLKERKCASDAQLDLGLVTHGRRPGEGESQQEHHVVGERASRCAAGTC